MMTRGASGESLAPLSQILLAAALAIERLSAGQKLSESIDQAAKRYALTGRSRAALQDIAFETTRRLGWVRALAQRLNNKLPDEPLLCLQSVALVQLDNVLEAGAALEKPTRESANRSVSELAGESKQSLRHPAVVVDQAVAAARVAGAHPSRGAFLNATLRRFQRERAVLCAELEKLPLAQGNVPAWWLGRLQQDRPQVWQSILAAQRQAAPLTLRVNRRRARRDELLAQWRESGLRAQAVGQDGIALAKSIDVTLLPGFEQGWFSVQDAGAQLAAPLLDAQPGQRVLDACAAPGGKTAHLLEMVDGLKVLALDSDAVRLRRVADNLDRLGLSAVMQAADAGDPRHWWDGKPFERILLDAPCTASGIVRRHPDIPWLRKRGDITTLAAQQQRLLKALWPSLAAGGKLLYVTCSVFLAEGVHVVRDFVERQPDALPLNIDWNWTTGMKSPASVLQPTEVARSPASLTLLPTSTPTFVSTSVREPLTRIGAPPADLIRDHDGFFYALLEKRG